MTKVLSSWTARFSTHLLRTFLVTISFLIRDLVTAKMGITYSVSERKGKDSTITTLSTGRGCRKEALIKGELANKENRKGGAYYLQIATVYRKND